MSDVGTRLLSELGMMSKSWRDLGSLIDKTYLSWEEPRRATTSLTFALQSPSHLYYLVSKMS